MKIVRHVSIYDKQRRRDADNARHVPIWLSIGGGLLVIGLLAGVTAKSPPDLAGWAMVAVVWCAGVIAVRLLGGGVGQGEAGELAAERALASLSDDYLALTSFRIPGKEKIGDIDLIVIGPFGVAVIEVKNIRSHCQVHGERWMTLSRSGAPLRAFSVSTQLRNQIKALTGFLVRQGASPTVTGMIAINSNAWIDVVSPPPYSIVTYDRLADTIMALPPLSRQGQISQCREILCSTPLTT